uniref:Uncharacterized protein n=1 Tax=uncultured marine virus TaxID=186617 RepID=A0A0F7L7N5_9VIRU|nr:hypothetical protein [uncultured marine virus]
MISTWGLRCLRLERSTDVGCGSSTSSGSTMSIVLSIRSLSTWRRMLSISRLSFRS